MSLIDDLQDHQKKSKNYLGTIRENWRDYESMIICSHREAMQTKNKVYDPRLGTIELERTARVMAQRPSGKAKPLSTNDTGKAKLMNLLLGYQMDNAKEQFSFLIKLRLLSFWSRVYGALYALVPWRITDNYIGPELNLISIWDSFPQPNVQLADADWFIQANRLGIKWLLRQDPKTWKMSEIKDLASEMKRDKDEGDVRQADDTSGHIEDEMYPSQFGDHLYPQVKVYTEYQKEKWITWAEQRINKKYSRPHILREVDNRKGQVYPEGMLPIINKHGLLPLLGGPIGVGPMQRGKSLQFATNQLINLFMSSVKSSITPELQINPRNVVPSSIKWGAAEKWFMNSPGKDVVPVQKGAEVLNTFNTAYGLFIGALLNQGGTTDTSSSNFVQTSLGKTPQALRLQVAAQSALDEWEEVMIHDAIGQIMNRWMALNANNLEIGIPLRLFGQEMEEISQQYPDIAEMFENNGREAFRVEGEPVKFDYDMEIGATSKPNLEEDRQSITDMIDFVKNSPDFIERMRAKGKDINEPELFERLLKLKGIKDTDNIITDAQTQPGMEGMQPGMQDMPPAEEPMPKYDDPDIDALAQQVLGGVQGVPAV